MWAQHKIVSPSVTSDHSFAIIVDKATYDACEKELLDYKQSIENSGLAAWIAADCWNSPEEVASLLRQWYGEKNLEGAVFVGDIPIAMVGGAQHLTSAFKMDERKYPKYDSYVPTDRFYDDFDMKFRFEERDSLHHQLFYYRLAPESAQKIGCEIYTGRIRPTAKGEAANEQVRAYLRKVVKAKGENNPLDKVVSYTGHGSYSNSLIAWKDDAVVMKEQFPAAYKKAGDAKSYIFFSYPDDIKEVLSRELQRPEVDVMFFHEHGVTERQYLTETPIAEDEDGFVEKGRRIARERIRNYKRFSFKSPEEAMADLMKRYGVDSSWFEGWDDPAVKAKDSLVDIATGIVLDDIRKIAPQPKVVVFDACYNGDYRDGDFVAGEYIFGNGGTVACFANSVNVLQDKSASDLMGMLTAGYSVGEWTKNIHILESHIIGDPTFCFQSDNARPVNLHEKSEEYWLSVLKDETLLPDLQSIALYKLFQMNYPAMSELLLETYRTSKWYTQRLQCMHLLEYYNDGRYLELLSEALDDPYEFIRRRGSFFMGMTGCNKFVPLLVNQVLEDYMAKRVLFNATRSFELLSIPYVRSTMREAIEKSDFIFDKNEFGKVAESYISRAESGQAGVMSALCDPASGRRFYINSMRNVPIPMAAPEVLEAIASDKFDLKTKVALAEVLGWFKYAYNKPMIISGLETILADDELEPELRDEITKTIGRLKVYMR